jgi:hypothetical protein
MDALSFRAGVRSLTFCAAAVLLALSCFGQTSPASAPPPDPAQAPQQESKRLFGLFPNYRSSPPLTSYKPLTAKEKFAIGANDSFDRGAIILALAFAGKGQLTNANPSFGQGAAGFGKYFGAGYTDVILGDMFTESIFPTAFHQDPRYFRRGTGRGWSRLGYAMAQIFVTHRDSGGKEFNFSEIFGNTCAVAISNTYYPDQRDVGSNVSKLGLQIGIDMAGNILKEFGPDVIRKLSRKPKPGSAPANPAPKH